MSTRIEFMGVGAVLQFARIIMPGEEWVGEQYQDEPVLIVASNEITAVEGSLEEIKALGQRIVQLVDQLDLGPTTEGSNES